MVYLIIVSNMVQIKLIDLMLLHPPPAAHLSAFCIVQPEVQHAGLAVQPISLGPRNIKHHQWWMTISLYFTVASVCSQPSTINFSNCTPYPLPHILKCIASIHNETFYTSTWHNNTLSWIWLFQFFIYNKNDFSSSFTMNLISSVLD